jgi:hypothetical protein
MRKPWSYGLLLAFVALALAGCGGAPASWEARATPTAAALLPKASIQGSCRQITKGSIGPFSAPYLECAQLTPDEEHAEVDYRLYEPQRGLVYAPGASAPREIPEECAKKLIGGWWEYHSINPQTGCMTGWVWMPSPA